MMDQAKDDLIDCKVNNDFVLNENQIKELERLCGKSTLEDVVRIESQYLSCACKRCFDKVKEINNG
jgi:hypothetical protein